MLFCLSYSNKPIIIKIIGVRIRPILETPDTGCGGIGALPETLGVVVTCAIMTFDGAGVVVI